MAKNPTSTIRFLGPINFEVYNYNPFTSQQPPDTPDVFKDALTVREAVFVKEQGVPAEMELDADDARSCHWVIYDQAPGHTEVVPVGTIRMVPFPHAPHPLPGSSWDADEDSKACMETPRPPPYITDRATSLHDGLEPYIKLGRLAVLKEFRGRKLANLLVNTAIEWAEKHSDYFNPSPSRAPSAGRDFELDTYRTTWNGLICVHAQERVVDSWAKWGFVVDNRMGKWTEAGIPHVGMFKRVYVSKTAADVLISNGVEP